MPRLWLIAVPALVASGLVLAIAQVGAAVWTQQAVAVVLAAAAAVAGRRWRAGAPRAWVVIVLALLCLAATLVSAGPPPHRWLALGPLRLYMAPVVLPVLLLTLGAAPHAGHARAVAALVTAGLLLALQPDASQVVALLVAVVAGATTGGPLRRTHVAACVMLAVLTAWTFTGPDPLQPVPHVEGVVALSLAHSWIAGVMVLAAASSVVVGLWLCAQRHLAAYYATLLACSLAGLTPAPLIGYGAGPWLGYGVFVALATSAGTVLDADQRRVS